MYEELDEYLSGSFLLDYWYDEGVMIASDILRKFNQKDWEKLLGNILSKPRDWQIRYAYAANISNEFVLKSLIILSGIDDDELFETAIDSLRALVISDNSLKISNDQVIRERVEKMMRKCDRVSKKMFEDFISKLPTMK